MEGPSDDVNNLVCHLSALILSGLKGRCLCRACHTSHLSFSDICTHETFAAGIQGSCRAGRWCHPIGKAPHRFMPYHLWSRRGICSSGIE